MWRGDDEPVKHSHDGHVGSTVVGCVIERSDMRWSMASPYFIRVFPCADRSIHVFNFCIHFLSLKTSLPTCTNLVDPILACINLPRASVKQNFLSCLGSLANAMGLFKVGE